jgi:hypothetical protein
LLRAFRREHFLVRTKLTSLNVLTVATANNAFMHFLRTKTLSTFLTIFAVWTLFGVAQAQSGTAGQPKSADWTGFYRIARGKDLGESKPLNMNLNEVIIAHLQPWARAKMEATDGVADDTAAVCQPDGIFRYPAVAGTFLWLPSSDKILIVYWELNTAGVQRIHLNRTHPKNLLPTWNGYSTGHREGDTLVVDTIGFNDKSWLQPAMEPHTEEAHMIQRIRQVGGGALIEMVWKVEDRQALTSAYTYSRYYKKVGQSMEANFCNQEPQTWRDFRKKHLDSQLERARKVK